MKPLRIYLYNYNQEDLDKLKEKDIKLSKAIDKILREYINK